MQTTVKIIMETLLDNETVDEITMMRNLRLSHYKDMLSSPEKTLKTLHQAGLTESTSLEQILAKALEKISEIESRQRHPHVIFEDEISLYLSSMDSDVC